MAQGYQPLATKYRPQRFADVVGQEVASRTLQNAIKAGRISHAYIFSGMRGVGKTTTARLLAKCLNCQSEELPTPEPCGECDSCREISAGRAMDVLEIDAASNTSVDDVRALQENLMYAPARDRYKVYIVDEVHMLSKSAFNAFLKTLEEPPDHVAFIFATTELNKIPPTVLSRCLVFEFGRVSGTAIKNRLAWICEQEGVKASEDALDLIVFQSEGSIRDAISALDQVINFADGDVSYEIAMRALGLIDREILMQAIAAVIAQDSKATFAAVQQVSQAGADMRLFCRHAIRHIRDLLVVKTLGTDTSMLPYSAEEIQLLEQQASGVSEEDLSRFFDILVKTDQDMQFSSTPQFLLETALIKMIHSTRLISLTDLISRLESGNLSLPQGAVSPVSTASATIQSDNRVTHVAPAIGKDPKQSLITSLKESGIKTLLRTAAVAIEDDTLVITFSRNSMALPLRSEERQTALKTAAKEAFGKSLKVEVRVETQSHERSIEIDDPRPEKPAPETEPVEVTSRNREQVEKDSEKDVSQALREDPKARLLIDELQLEIDTVNKVNKEKPE
jgi:DNA polymerase-3 subunit gamma/tau